MIFVYLLVIFIESTTNIQIVKYDMNTKQMNHISTIKLSEKNTIKKTNKWSYIERTLTIF